MDPNKVKLTFREAIGPTLRVAKESAFVIVLSVLILLVSENMYVASLLPTMIASSTILNALFCFGLALVVQVIGLLPFALFLAWWFDNENDSGKDLYYKFRRELNSELLKKRKEVLANAEEEMLK